MILNKLGSIQRNEIVVINRDFTGTEVIIKRVIGMPNEVIKCENGNIYINDEKYDDKYAYGYTDDFDEVFLNDNEYFVMGDNRVVSKDSRILGPVNGKYIEGTTNFIIFPIGHFGGV